MSAVFALTKRQIAELRLIKPEDAGYMARGDQADFVSSGLAKPPRNASGWYRLTTSGEEAWRAVWQGRSA